jgi:hypothetical protein
MSSTGTTQNWACRLTSTAEIPDSFRNAYEELALGDSNFPVVLYSPEFGLGRDREAARLLVWLDDRLVCFGRDLRGIVRSELSMSEIHSAQWGTVLLHSWLRFQGPVREEARTIQVDFNTVCFDLYLPVLQAYLRRIYVGCESDFQHERAKFDGFIRSDFKFMNLGRDALEPGMEVQKVLLQSRLSRRCLHFFQRTILPAVMLIVTQRELIVVSEGYDRVESEYATVWTYFVREGMERLWVDTVTFRGEVVHNLHIAMRGGYSTTASLAGAREHEVSEVIDLCAPSCRSPPGHSAGPPGGPLNR